jgi:hypothetical protein
VLSPERMWAREAIDRKQHSTIDISMLTALNCPAQLRTRLGRTLSNGCTVGRDPRNLSAGRGLLRPAGPQAAGMITVSWKQTNGAEVSIMMPTSHSSRRSRRRAKPLCGGLRRPATGRGMTAALRRWSGCDSFRRRGHRSTAEVQVQVDIHAMLCPPPQCPRASSGLQTQFCVI